MTRLHSTQTLRLAGAITLLTGALFVGAYSTTDLSRASTPFLNRFFATLSDDDKHDPKNAVASLNVAPGLQATLFAAEPMLKNPTNIDVDARGRVWVAKRITTVRPSTATPPTPPATAW